MINGLYSGASAMDIFSRQQELVASNLAHLNTPGHRRALFSFQEKTDATGETVPGTNVDKTATDFSQGRLEPTGRPLDIALQGDGFFAYQGENATVYSRNGVLFRNGTGQLVNGDGLPILSNGAPVVIPPDVSDTALVIDKTGAILADGNKIGKLTVTQFNDNQLLSSDSRTYFLAGDAIGSPAQEFRIEQGLRELSNAQPVTEMISLIVGSRNFEASQRVMRTISETIKENVQA
jgi:flagellar basal-body rod protein FlgF